MRFRHRVRLSRDTFLLLMGVAGIAHETLVASAERPTLLLLFAAMIGLPAFLRHDEHQSEQDPKKNRDMENQT